MFRPSLALLASMGAALCLAAMQYADGAHLVRDINAESASGNSGLNSVVELGNVMLFVTDDNVRGAELWSSDGTAAGTRLVRDINPGPAGSEISALTVLGDAAYFFANDGTNGMELWRSDGTTAGTSIVANIGPGSLGFSGTITFGSPITTHGGLLYFTASDSQSGEELWRSDGTRTGTYRLIDINSGGAGSNPGEFISVGTNLFFTADDGVHGRELWVTDGTVAGTGLVSDMAPGPASGVGGLLSAAVAGNALYLAADDGIHGREPWRATASGASMIVDLNTRQDALDPGKNDGSMPLGFIPAGDRALFVAQTFDDILRRFVPRLYRITGDHSVEVVMEVPPFTDVVTLAHLSGRTLFHFSQSSGSLGDELWVTDGTAAGTAPLRPGGAPLIPSDSASTTVRNESEVFFYGSTTFGGPEKLWRSDGTSAGTHEFGAVPSGVFELARLRNDLYFRAGRFTDPVAGEELWVSDGTPAGTHRVADINPGPAHSQPFSLFPALGKLFFVADDGVHGVEPWVSDGTEAGTVALGDLNSVIRSQGSEPDLMLPFGNGVLLAADDGHSGSELWFSDGTTGGTQMVADIAPGPGTSGARDFVALQGFALFSANDGASGRELWRTDGTAMGTQRVLDIAPGGASGADMMDFGAVVLNGVAYFAANDGMNGDELWRSNGTAAGTFMVADSTAGPGGTGTFVFGVVGQRVVFRYQNRLWSSNGTAAGTAQVLNDVEVLSTFEVASFNGLLYFAARDDQTGDAELWRTDGTAAGTRPVTDLTPNESLFVSSIQAAGNTLYFTGCISGQSRCDLYSSDGSNAGTHRILDGSASLVRVTDGTRVFFFNGQTSPQRIFVSDGTAAGTRPFLPDGTNLGGDPIVMTWFNGALIFTVNDQQRGPVIWRSDGTASGTRRILDLDPDIDPSRPPNDYMPVGSRLFFTADNVASGNELYVLDDDRPFANADMAHTDFNSSVRIPVLDNDAAFTGQLNHSSVELTANPQSGSASVDAATGEIVYVPNAGFTGMDTLQYRVQDDRGRASDSAAVFVIVGAVQGQGPGTPPTPPSSPPPSTPPGNSSGGGGGGGGACNWLMLIVLATLSVARRRRVGSG